MTIEVPDQELGSIRLSTAEAKLDFAIGLYTGRHLSIGKSAKVAGLSYPAFLQELGRRGICLNYSADDLAHDLKMIETSDPNGHR
jgi:predicted HTH domain antitoxin